MQNEIQWYDSGWLSRYLSAKDYIAKFCPEKLEAFVTRLDVLRTDPNFKVRDLPGLLDHDVLDFVKTIIRRIPQSNMQLHEIDGFGRRIWHDHPVFLKMQANLTSRVSDWVGEEVEPCYNFLSLYTDRGICEPHLDAPEAKWTLDICIDQSEPWPIHFSQVVPWPESVRDLGEDWREVIKSDPHLKFEAKVLEPGNAILFAGSSQWHYRDALPQNADRGFCHLLFFHYIPKGTSEIVKPKNWAQLFEIPELAGIVGNYPA